MFDIYMITNTLNDKKYIGYTYLGFEKRFLKHINEANHGSNRILCKAIRKYGKEKFKIECIDRANTHEEACEKEIMYIKKYNTFAYTQNGYGYNQTVGGDGANGYKMPKRLIELARERQKGKWAGENNPNYGKGHLMTGEKHFNYGKHHSLKTLKKISASNKGKYDGNKNNMAIRAISYAKECSTGKI